MAIREIPLPIRGFFEGFSVHQQPDATTGYACNVRATDVLEKRIRIGQRPGLKRWGEPTKVGAEEQPVINMAVVGSVL